jgi:hypothetical protein
MKRHKAGASIENSMHSDQENSSQNNESTSSQVEVAAYETANQVLERSLIDQAMNSPFTQESVLTMETPRRPRSLNLDPRLRRLRTRVVPNFIDNSGSGQEAVEVITINTDGEEAENNE